MSNLASKVRITAGQSLCGLMAGTGVMTAKGNCPVEHLIPGDRIVTRAGLRVLRSSTFQVVATATLVRVDTDTLGVGRPEVSTLVVSGQPILIRDWRAKALTGSSVALIAAARLVDGQFIRSETHSQVTIHTLHFDQAEIIYAGGLELGCDAAA